MKTLERLGLAALRRFNPETAHDLSIMALRAGLVPMPGVPTSPRLRVTLAGIELPNPVGLAAGYDKNAKALAPLCRAGFGFIEVGATTPRPQPGDPKPRLFRLTEDHAAINRFGFNNDGAGAIASRLVRRPRDAVIGLNLGANKNSADRAADFASVLAACGSYVDFATVNISSPNTSKLRELQEADTLIDLLAIVLATRDALARPIPVFVKIAPDLTDTQIEGIATAARRAGIDGVIATNTTLSRQGLLSIHRDQAGGLSGAPLFDKSTRVLARLAYATEGKLPLIGVGGVFTAEQAYAKIQAGASAVQLYTAMIYKGIGTAADIARGLDALLSRDGHASVAAAVGTKIQDWI